MGSESETNFFIRINEDSNIWMGKCANTRLVSGLSNTKLVDHVRKDHIDDFELFLSENVKCTISSSADGNLFFRRKTGHLHG